MISPQAIEAGARAIYEGRNGKGCKPWSLQTKAHKEPYLHDAQACLTAALAADGMALVPVEPTEAMLAAGHDHAVPSTQSIGAIYAAMLKAVEG